MGEWKDEAKQGGMDGTCLSVTSNSVLQNLFKANDQDFLFPELHEPGMSCTSIQ